MKATNLLKSSPVALALVFASTAPASAQWAPALDSVAASASASPEWQNFLLGDWAAKVYADVMLAGAPIVFEKGFGLSVHGYAWTSDERPSAPTTALLGGGVSLHWWFVAPREGAYVQLVADGYTLPGEDDGETNGVEVGLRAANISFRSPLGEESVNLAIGAYRDFGRFDAARVDFEISTGAWATANVGLFVEGRLSWAEDWSGWDEVTHGELDAVSGRLNLLLGYNDDGTMGIRLRLGGSNLRNSDLRFFGELTIRYWPWAG